MASRKSLAVAAVIIALAIGLAVYLLLPAGKAPLHATPATPPSFTASKILTVIDDANRTVVVRLPVKRVVVLGGSDAYLAFKILNATNYIVGVDMYVYRLSPQLLGNLSAPPVGSAFEPNIEAIIALRPDLVITYAQWPGPDFDKKMAEANITVVRLNFYMPSQICRDMLILGEILNKTRRAEEYCAFLNRTLSLVEARLAKVQKLRAYRGWFNYPSMQWGGWAWGPGSGGYDFAHFAGLALITSNFTTPYPKVSQEWVAAQNPDAIVLVPMAITPNYNLTHNIFCDMAEKMVYKNPVLNSTNAALKRRVVVVDVSFYDGVFFPLALLYVDKALYPAAFANVNPAAFADQFFKEFLGMPFRGYWLCPQS